LRSATINDPWNFTGAKKTIGDKEKKQMEKRGFHRLGQRSK